jgi:hypothetical protein
MQGDAGITAERKKKTAHMVVRACEAQRKLCARQGVSGLVCRPSEFTQYVFSITYDSLYPLEWMVRLRFSDFVEFDWLLRRWITPQRVHDPEIAFTIEYLHTIRIQQYLGKHNISLSFSRVCVCVRTFEPEELRGVNQLPERTYFSRNDSKELIEQRKRRLEAYLNSLGNSKAAMESGALKHFLSFPDEESIYDMQRTQPNDAHVHMSEMHQRTLWGGSAFAVCRECKAVLVADRDDLDTSRCSLCVRLSAPEGSMIQL